MYGSGSEIRAIHVKYTCKPRSIGMREALMPRSRDESKSVPPRVVRAERREKERMRGSKRRCEVSARARGEGGEIVRGYFLRKDNYTEVVVSCVNTTKV